MKLLMMGPVECLDQTMTAVITGARIAVHVVRNLPARRRGIKEDNLASLEDKVSQRLRSLPLCEKYYGSLVQQRLGRPMPHKSDLISAFKKPDGRAESLEEQLCRLEPLVRNFEAMFDLKLGNDPQPDERILDHRFEIDTADYLADAGFQQIEYIRASEKEKTPDFVCRREGAPVCVEVKALREREFKDFEEAIPGWPDSPYVRSDKSDRGMYLVLRTRITEALEQIDSYVARHGLAGCQKVVALYLNSVDYRSVFRKATLENLRTLYDDEFSSKVDRVLLFLDDCRNPQVLEPILCP